MENSEGIRTYEFSITESKGCKDLSLNHCTVLYYICDVPTCKTDIDITKSKLNLNWHCDIKHNASSGVKAHGGQCADFPTVIVPLCDSH